MLYSGFPPSQTQSQEDSDKVWKEKYSLTAEQIKKYITGKSIPSITAADRPAIDDFIAHLTYPSYSQVPVTGMGKKGDAVCHIDGYTVFIRQPLGRHVKSGDRINIRIENWKEEQKLAWGKVLEELF
jgi:predicted RNA-binding protein with TRAM domain